MTVATPAFLKGVDVEVSRTVTFSAGHRYASPSFSPDENKKIYGSLFREEGFGHNFLLEAHFAGPVDFETGMIANLVDIDRWMKAVSSEFDHKMLNELPDFTGVAPTLERIAFAFFEKLRARINGRVRLSRVRLYEGDDTWVDFFG